MSKFQILFIGIFIVCIVAGVALFATYKSKDPDTSLPSITIWGTFPSSIVASLTRELNTVRQQALRIQYVEKSEAGFDREFIEALARGQGPDAILIPQHKLLRHEDKIIPIPATLITERDFKNTYIPLAELYLSQRREALAIPFTVDPLVMYWNRDIFTNAGIAAYPRFWDEFTALVGAINVKDANSNIRRSAIAMGEFNNINNAREVLGTLLMQAGNPVTTRGDATSGGRIVSTVGDGQYQGARLSQPAVSFFTQFANPRDPLYSWNRSLPLAKSWFLSGSLATYFGFSSELFDLRVKNPNIDYDVAPLPQPRTGTLRATYGKMYGLSIVRSTANPSATYSVLSSLAAPDALAILGKVSFLPPVRRDMIAAGSKDPYQTIFYDSALISKGWIDMDSSETNRIFQAMVESITSGRSDIREAIQTAHRAIDLSLQKP